MRDVRVKREKGGRRCERGGADLGGTLGGWGVGWLRAKNTTSHGEKTSDPKHYTKLHNSSRKRSSECAMLRRMHLNRTELQKHIIQK